MPGGFYPPPSVIESWPKPNYVDPVTRGPALIYVSIVFSTLSLVIVPARIYSRIFITKAPGADDLLIAIAAGFSIAFGILLVIQEKTWYIGRHIWDIPVDKFAGQRKNAYLCEWCYVVASSAVKISILLFYRRLSVTFPKTFLIATWVGIAYQVVYLIICMSLLLVLFKPLDSYWLSFDPTWVATHKYSHGNEEISLLMSAAFSVVGDFYSTALPLLLVTFLDLPARQKTALYALFGLGFLVVAAGTVRTILLYKIIAKTYDTSWTIWEDWTWTVLEINLAILAASAPALKPFFRRFVIDPIAGTAEKLPTHTNRSEDRQGANRRALVVVTVGESRSKADIIAEEINDETSTRRYQLRTSQDGKMVPVEIYEQASFDNQSAHTACSSDCILPPGKSSGFDASTELRRYHTQIQSLPTVSGQQHYPLQNRNRSNNGPTSIPGPLARNPSQPS